MKKHLLIIPVSIVLAIFFYPTTSNSNSTGSVGGKTGSPTDGSSCTQVNFIIIVYYLIVIKSGTKLQ